MKQQGKRELPPILYLFNVKTFCFFSPSTCAKRFVITSCVECATKAVLTQSPIFDRPLSLILSSPSLTHYGQHGRRHRRFRRRRRPIHRDQDLRDQLRASRRQRANGRPALHDVARIAQYPGSAAAAAAKRGAAERRRAHLDGRRD